MKIAHTIFHIVKNILDKEGKFVSAINAIK